METRELRRLTCSEAQRLALYAHQRSFRHWLPPPLRRVPQVRIPVYIPNFRPSSDKSVLSHEVTCLSVVMIC